MSNDATPNLLHIHPDSNDYGIAVTIITGARGLAVRMNGSNVVVHKTKEPNEPYVAYVNSGQYSGIFRGFAGVEVDTDVDELYPDANYVVRVKPIDRRDWNTRLAMWANSARVETVTVYTVVRKGK